LLDNELIVALVLVETANDVVSIAPRIRAFVIIRIAPRVGVAHDVEPVPSPLFPVAWRSEQPFHHFVKSSARAVSKEALYLLRRGGQTRQVVSHAPDQLKARGRRSRGKSGLFELPENERVNRRTTRAAHFRNLRMLHGIEGPGRAYFRVLRGPGRGRRRSHLKHDEPCGKYR